MCVCVEPLKRVIVIRFPAFRLQPRGSVCLCVLGSGYLYMLYFARNLIHPAVNLLLFYVTWI